MKIKEYLLVDNKKEITLNIEVKNDKDLLKLADLLNNHGYNFEEI